jgi:hypothetical protein
MLRCQGPFARYGPLIWFGDGTLLSDEQMRKTMLRQATAAAIIAGASPTTAVARLVARADDMLVECAGK